MEEVFASCGVGGRCARRGLSAGRRSALGGARINPASSDARGCVRRDHASRSDLNGSSGVVECWSIGVMNYETKLRNKNRGYMKLIVWQKAIELFELVWAIVFTENKIDFKLRSQLADAAQSVSANISEGYGRRSLNEYIQFLYYARGRSQPNQANRWSAFP